MITTLAFWSCSDVYVDFQKANVVITTGIETQRENHCRTREPTWSSLQDQKVNLVITTGIESQRGHPLVFWSCSDDHVDFLVLQ
jgi:hypothetical protein